MDHWSAYVATSSLSLRRYVVVSNRRYVLVATSLRRESLRRPYVVSRCVVATSPRRESPRRRYVVSRYVVATSLRNRCRYLATSYVAASSSSLSLHLRRLLLPHILARCIILDGVFVDH